MKKLRKDCFMRTREAIMEYGRPLENSIFQWYFNGGTPTKIIDELKKFQNEDGGFGHGIESDYRLPSSSPMATSVGIRLLAEIDDLIESKEMIESAIHYLENSFDEERNGWFAVPKTVNNFPHAPWWHYDIKEGMTIIDENWGNPSAEILAYIYRYRDCVKKLDVDGLVEYAIKYLENKQEFNSEHEVFCYIKLYEALPKDLQKRLEKRITFAIEQVIVYDEEKWHEYIPRPIDFVEDSCSPRFGVLESKLENNLNYIIRELELKGKILPPWGEDLYKEDLKEAYNEWVGVLTLKALMILDKFKKISR